MKKFAAKVLFKFRGYTLFDYWLRCEEDPMWEWLVRLFGGACKMAGHEERLVALEARANDHERRLVFLEVYREVFAEALARIHDLQAIQSNQSIRMNNLTQSVEGGLLPRLSQLELLAPDENDRHEVVKLRKQVKNNLTRAQKKVAG